VPHQVPIWASDPSAPFPPTQGAIISYIHPGSRLGVMLEVNCETDFVAASDKFQALAKSIAMQIAASPQVQYVATEDIPAEIFEREKQVGGMASCACVEKESSSGVLKRVCGSKRVLWKQVNVGRTMT
jgi:translation elongation factor EF-Ts